ncbi:MAG: helix-turn-helix domain-containing protein [Spirochaetes bacterium]|nr:MAG: helix-turn-helix domain-containing protein [Spirochaetota bacterium]
MRKYAAYEAQVWARKQRLGGDVAAKIILMILADYADEWGTCYPGVDRIAEEAELSKSTVLRRLKALAEAGLVTVERRANERGHRTSNRYVLEIEVTVTAEQWNAVVQRVVARVAEPLEEVQGVNVTPGSQAPPKCQPEREAKVSPGDTGTTSRTTSSTPYPHGGGPDFPYLGTGEQQQGSQAVLSLVVDSAPSAAPTGPQIAFSEFWALYPRKTSKIAAEKAWTKITRTVDPAVIVAAVPAHVALWRREQRPLDKVPYPATWLNNGSWQDEMPAAPEQVASPWSTAPSAAEVYRQTVGEA